MNALKKLWAELNKPSSYDIWNESFQRLKEERSQHGQSEKYWEIWKEVCPAYKNLCDSTPKFLQAPDTDKVLHDMNLKVNERKYF